MGTFIGGDAMVASSPSGHFATTHNATNIIDKNRPEPEYESGGRKPKTPKRTGGGGGGRGQQAPPPPPVAPMKALNNKPITHTKKTGELLCQAFNAGNCGATHGAGCDGGKCPSDSTKRHLCHWCLGAHSAVRCDPSGAFKKQGGGNGKKKGGKGKGGKH